MEDVIPNPLKNFTPRQNPVKADQPPAASPAPDIAGLDDMTREQLIALVRRFASQCGMVAMMTDEETAQAMLDVLAETALKPVAPGVNMKADITSRLNAVEKWLDRKKGKPVGSSPLVQIGTSGDVNVMIRLVDAAGNIETIEN